jgi:hypothetical protein
MINYLNFEDTTDVSWLNTVDTSWASTQLQAGIYAEIWDSRSIIHRYVLVDSLANRQVLASSLVARTLDKQSITRT